MSNTTITRIMTSSDSNARHSIARLAEILRVYANGIRYYAGKLSNYEARIESQWIANEIEIQADKLKKIENYYKKNEKTKTTV